MFIMAFLCRHFITVSFILSLLLHKYLRIGFMVLLLLCLFCITFDSYFYIFRDKYFQSFMSFYQFCLFVTEGQRNGENAGVSVTLERT